MVVDICKQYALMSPATNLFHAFRKTFPRLEIEKGLVLAPVDAAFPISEQDYALPWDLTLAKND